MQESVSDESRGDQWAVRSMDQLECKEEEGLKVSLNGAS